MPRRRWVSCTQRGSALADSGLEATVDGQPMSKRGVTVAADVTRSGQFGICSLYWLERPNERSRCI